MPSPVFFCAIVLVIGQGVQSNYVKVSSNLADSTTHIQCGASPKNLKNNQSVALEFSPKTFACDSYFYCDISTTDGKKAHFETWRKGFPENVGYFLKAGGVYKGDLDGQNLKKVTDYNQ